MTNDDELTVDKILAAGSSDGFEDIARSLGRARRQLRRHGVARKTADQMVQVVWNGFVQAFVHGQIIEHHTQAARKDAE